MSRFVYYLILSNMIANLVAAVPRILIGKSSDGALLAIIIAICLGVFMNWLFINTMSNFPGKTVPQLFERHLSKWVGVPAVLLLALIWYIAGIQTLITYIDIMQHFLTTGMSVYLLFLMFIPCITLGFFMHSRNVLFSLEVLLVTLAPIMLLFLGELYFTRNVDWDYVKIAMTHIEKMPDYSVFAATIFLFLGSFDLILFNSMLTNKIKFGWKQAGIIASFGVVALFTIYFMPIGILGFDEVEETLYPMILTSDSLRMKFGVIERVIFIFQLNFLAFAFLNILLHWHVAFKFLQFTFGTEKLKGKRKYFSNGLLVAALWGAALFMTILETEYDLFTYSEYYFNTLPAVFVLLMTLLFIVKRRAKLEKR